MHIQISLYAEWKNSLNSLRHKSSTRKFNFDKFKLITGVRIQWLTMVVQVVGEANHHSKCKNSDNHENICCHICHPNIRSKQFLVFICRVHFVCVYECMAQHVCMYLCFPTNELSSWEQKNVRNFHTDANIFKSSSPFSAMFFVQNIAMQPSSGEYRIYVCTYIEYLYLQWNETNRIFYICNYVKTLIDWLVQRLIWIFIIFYVTGSNVPPL